MSALDIEKTQVWFSGVKEQLDAPVAAKEGLSKLPKIPPTALQKPKLPAKKMSKEEKILLATGGALAVGLGAIVITSLPEKEESRNLTPEPIDLTAPVLDLDLPIREPEPVPPPAPPPPAPRRPRPVQKVEEAAAEPEAAPVKPLEAFPLLNLPENPPVATGVSDESTFLEAYDTARAEVGPGGIFAWQGTYYSTFTEREWESVSPENQAKWLGVVGPMINPELENEVDVSAGDQVFIADRGAISWTGIDQNEDGVVEVLIARVQGQPPMVLVDTNTDGTLDTRYDFHPESGKTTSAAITPLRLTAEDIAQIEYLEVEDNMGFFSPDNSVVVDGASDIPVAITRKDGVFMVEIDQDHDYIVETISILKDGSNPVVGMDLDHDGRIDTGFVYNPLDGSVVSLETEPMDPVVFSNNPVAANASPEQEYGMIGPPTQDEYDDLYDEEKGHGFGGFPEENGNLLNDS